VLMWRNSATRCSAALEMNKSLLYHRSVQVIDVFLTRIALEVCGATGSLIVLSAVFIYLGWMRPPVDFLLVVTGWLMLAWFGASLALLIGAGTAFSPIVERLWHPAAYLFFPISGAAFMVDWLPRKFQTVVLLLPTVHGVEMLRHGYFGNVVPSHYDMGYMAICCLVLSVAALLAVREAGRRVEF
jgi:capsular polysaccharide transport system permease protein